MLIVYEIWGSDRMQSCFRANVKSETTQGLTMAYDAALCGAGQSHAGQAAQHRMRGSEWRGHMRRVSSRDRRHLVVLGHACIVTDVRG